MINWLKRLWARLRGRRIPTELPAVKMPELTRVAPRPQYRSTEDYGRSLQDRGLVFRGAMKPSIDTRLMPPPRQEPPPAPPAPVRQDLADAIVYMSLYGNRGATSAPSVNDTPATSQSTSDEVAPSSMECRREDYAERVEPPAPAPVEYAREEYAPADPPAPSDAYSSSSSGPSSSPSSDSGGSW